MFSSQHSESMKEELQVLLSFPCPGPDCQSYYFRAKPRNTIRGVRKMWRCVACSKEFACKSGDVALYDIAYSKEQNYIQSPPPGCNTLEKYASFMDQ